MFVDGDGVGGAAAAAAVGLGVGVGEGEGAVEGEGDGDGEGSVCRKVGGGKACRGASARFTIRGSMVGLDVGEGGDRVEG